MKEYKIKNQSLPDEGFGFSIGKRFVKLVDLTDEQAALVDSQFPGAYVEKIVSPKQKKKNDKNGIESPEIGDDQNEL